MSILRVRPLQGEQALSRSGSTRIHGQLPFSPAILKDLIDIFTGAAHIPAYWPLGLELFELDTLCPGLDLANVPRGFRDCTPWAKIGQWSDPDGVFTVTLAIPSLSEDLSTYSNSDHELVAFLSLSDGIVYPVESDWITKVTGHVAEPDNEARKHSLCPEQHSLNGDEGLISGHPRMIILDMSIFRKRLARYCTEYKFSKCNIVFDIEWSQSLNRKLDLSKMINVFGVVELTLNIADFLDLRSIDALRQTSRHFRNMRTLATVGKLRVQKVLTRALGTHHPGVKQHVSDFNRILSATCSIVGGSTALAILSPGKWIPGDMDIVVQDKYADTMEAFLTETIGLVLNVEKSQSSGLYPGGQGPPVHNVHDRNHIKFAYRRFDSPKPDQPGVDLTIIHPRSYNAQRHCAEWVLTYHSTVVMNFWTGRKLCSLWPDLTLSGKLLRNEYTPTPRIEAALEKYHLRGFTDIHENGSPDEKRYLQDDYPQAKGERLSMELIPGPTWRKEIVLV